MTDAIFGMVPMFVQFSQNVRHFACLARTRLGMWPGLGLRWNIEVSFLRKLSEWLFAFWTKLLGISSNINLYVVRQIGMF